MAQIANTFETFDAVGIREELAKTIFRITPEETPFLSSVGHTNVKTTHPEWQIDTLATPDPTNNQPEGNDWTYSAVTPTTRVGNYAQVSEKTFVVSATLDQTDKAGRDSELSYQGEKKGRELKTDMEVVLLSNQASSAGSGNAASNRKTGGFRAWLATNDQLGAGGSSGGFNSSTSVVDAATNGTQRAFTKALLDQAMLDSTNAGGNPSIAMMSTYNKGVFSTFLDDANIVPMRQEASPKGKRTLIASAEAYLSDFGLVSIMYNRQMTRAGAGTARNIFVYDPDYVKIGFFRDIQLHKPAKTGDAEKRVYNVEYMLKVGNEAAHAVIADTFGLSATT